MKKKVLEVNNLWVYFNKIAILEDINLEISEGDFLAIIGPNGGGKTTLIKAILGLLSPSRGMVKLFDDSIKKGRGLIGYVPQYSTESDYDFPISVKDVISMGKLPEKNVSKIEIENVLDRVGMLSHLNSKIGELSGGQRQRVFIARALISNPKMLILDEPTSSIDREMETGLYEFLQKLNKTVPIVVVTHDLTAVSKAVNKIACLNRKLFCHKTGDLPSDVVLKTYKCPVNFLAHGLPHKVLREHEED